MKKLIVVAHPDDETIYFSGLILSEPKTEWTVVSITDGNGDGRGEQRHKEFLRACKALKVKTALFLGFTDAPGQRLPVKLVWKKLHEVRAKHGPFSEIYTHSILGEYGHQHHQDASRITHEVFRDHKKVFSVAHNVMPDKKIQLKESHFNVKADIFWNTYRKEVERFLNFLPVTGFEGFAKVPHDEIAVIYDALVAADEKKSVSAGKLKHIRKHQWLIPFIKQGNVTGMGKLFISFYLAQSKSK